MEKTGLCHACGEPVESAPFLLPRRRCANVAQGGRIDRRPESAKKSPPCAIFAQHWISERTGDGFGRSHALLSVAQCLQRSGW